MASGFMFGGTKWPFPKALWKGSFEGRRVIFTHSNGEERRRFITMGRHGRCNGIGCGHHLIRLEASKAMCSCKTPLCSCARTHGLRFYAETRSKGWSLMHGE